MPFWTGEPVFPVLGQNSSLYRFLVHSLPLLPVMLGTGAEPFLFKPCVKEWENLESKALPSLLV